jgi:serine protease Do
MRRFFLCCFLIVLAPVMRAEIYQWTDEEGKVHFGEKQAAKDQKEATKVEVRGKYLIRDVEALNAIYYSNSSPHRLIDFTSIKLALPDSEHTNVRIGRITCGRPIDLYWQKGIVDFTHPNTIKSSISTFEKFGYAVRNGIKGGASAASLNLEAEIVDIKMNKCPAEKSDDITQNATFLKIKWKLYDPLAKKMLYSTETMGSHNAMSARAIRHGDDISFEAALALATNNLLADSEFAKVIVPVDMTTLVEKFDEEVNVHINYGTGAGSFKESADQLMKNAVIVKTKDGFGSGVVINNDGYVLTNAHVVGDETKFHILIGDNTLGAVLVRKEAIRDVALIKINDNYSRLEGVSVAKDQSDVGDEIFIIGAPLSLEHSQTTTKGIVSAYRDMQGLRYLQTDANVNHGSSGGPVFNEHGELIALTVAGLLTRDGAGLGINYLIPINDVFRYLKLGSAKNKNEMLASTDSWLQSKLAAENDNAFLSGVYRQFGVVLNWLNTPLFTIGNVEGATASAKDAPLPQVSGLTQLPDKLNNQMILRAKFADAVTRITPLKMSIAMYYVDHDQEWPSNFSDINVDGDSLSHPGLIESVTIELNGTLRADLSEETFGHGYYFELVPDAKEATLSMDWSCVTNLDKGLWVGSCTSDL